MDNSPLRTLAPELRIIIYELVLVTPSVIEVHLRGGIPYVEDSQSEDLQSRLPLISRCQEIYREAAPVFHGANRFTVHADVANKWTAWGRELDPNEMLATERSYVLRGWLHQLGPAAQHLRSIDVSLGAWRIIWSGVTAQDVYPVLKRFTAVDIGVKAQFSVSILVNWTVRAPVGPATLALAIVPNDMKTTSENVRQALEQQRALIRTSQADFWEPEKTLRICEAELDALLELMRH